MDKVGRPIYIERSGKNNPSKVFELISDDYFWKAFVQSYEELLKKYFMTCSLVKQRQIFHTFSINDMSGFSVGQMNSKVYNFI